LKHSAISVIIPTYKLDDSLFPLIDSLRKQSIGPSEIIITYGKREKEAYEKINKDNKIRLIKVVNDKGPNRARNIGLAAAKSDIIAFIDSDCIASHNWLENITEAYNRFNIDAIAGTVNTLNRHVFLARFQEYSLIKPIPQYSKTKILKKHLGLNLIVTANFSVKKSIAKKIGGFDESYYRFGADDLDFATRLLKNGYKILCSPDIIVYHKNREKIKRILRRYFNYGEGFSLYRIRHPLTFLSLIVTLSAYGTIIGYTLAAYFIYKGYIVIPLLVYLTPLLITILYHTLYSVLKKDFRLEKVAYPFLDFVLSLTSIMGIFYMDVLMFYRALKKIFKKLT